MDLSLNNDVAAQINSFADLAECNQIKGEVVPRSSPCPLDRKNPEQASLLIFCPSWFRPTSKNQKNSLSQYFSTSASRPRKEQEVWGRVKIERKEELNPLHVKGSKTSSVACHSTWVLMCFHCKPRGTILRQKSKTQNASAGTLSSNTDLFGNDCVPCRRQMWSLPKWVYTSWWCNLRKINSVHVLPTQYPCWTDWVVSRDVCKGCLRL